MEKLASSATANAVGVDVSVALILDSQRRVLISQRRPDLIQGGFWEFPGGKCERGELPDVALVRECQEELAITPLQCRPWIQLWHQYDDQPIMLHVFLVYAYQGEPVSQLSQPLQWVSQQSLVDYHLLPANAAIVAALQQIAGSFCADNP